MATAEQFTQSGPVEPVEPQIGWQDWQTVEAARWRLAYDALVGDVVALRAAITETRAELDALRADLAIDLAIADEIHHQTPLTSP